MKIILAILLFPFTLLYGTIVFIRNKLFDLQVLKSKKFDNIFVINVGNLSVGGTGKTPHVEYLIHELKNNFNCGILSRGYKRKSKGFILASETHSSEDIGDEPKQYKSKFDGVMVAVDEDRVHGIQKLTETKPDLDVVVLDDAYQHRSVKPHVNVLLTDFNRLYTNDLLMPAGRLREWSVGSKGADYIIVTKCPENLTENL